MGKGTRGAGIEIPFLSKHIHASRVEEYSKRHIRRKAEAVAVDAQKYKGQVEVILVGDFALRIGKASNPNENIEQYGESTQNKNGADILEFLKNNEMKTLSDSVKSRRQNGLCRQYIQKRERSILDHIVVGNGRSKETEVHVCAAT